MASCIGQTKITRLLIVLLALVLSACSLETGKTGGVVGLGEDHLLFNTDTDLGYTYRAAFVLTALTLVADHNLNNAGNEKQAIAQINGISVTISTLFAMAATPCGLPASVDTSSPPQSNLYDGILSPSGSVTTTNSQNAGTVTTTVATSASSTATGAASQTTATVANPSLTDMGGQCPGGIYRTQFQAETAQLDPQIFNLAAVALPEANFAKMVTTAEKGDYTSLFFDIAQAFWSTAISAHEAFAVERQNKQSWAYIQNIGAGTPATEISSPYYGTYEGAISQIPTVQVDSATDFENPFVYTAPMYALFKDVQQACYDIQGKLAPSDVATNQCPKTFLPILDDNGYPVVRPNFDTTDKTLVTSYSIQQECVPLDGIVVPGYDNQVIYDSDAYYCKDGDSTPTPTALLDKANDLSKASHDATVQAESAAPAAEAALQNAADATSTAVASTTQSVTEATASPQ